MNTISNHISTVTILIVSSLLAWLLVLNANAKLIEDERMRLYRPIESVSEQILDLYETSELKRYLRTNGWVKDSVSDEDLERYFTMVKQNCEGDTHAYPALILAVIAVESNFDTNAYSSAGARGLMQLMAMYHTSSLSQFKGSPASRDDFFVPEWNIPTGIAYLSEAIEAGCTYSSVDDPISDDLQEILSRGDVYRAKT